MQNILKTFAFILCSLLSGCLPEVIDFTPPKNSVFFDDSFVGTWSYFYRGDEEFRAEKVIITRQDSHYTCRIEGVDEDTKKELNIHFCDFQTFKHDGEKFALIQIENEGDKSLVLLSYTTENESIYLRGPNEDHSSALIKKGEIDGEIDKRGISPKIKISNYSLLNLWTNKDQEITSFFIELKKHNQSVDTIPVSAPR